MKLADIQALAATLPARHIFGEDGSPYLSRYKLHGWMPDDQVDVPCSVYLHHIHRHDLDPAPHSHPWDWSQTTILHGGYTEMRGIEQDKRFAELVRRGYRIGEGYFMPGDQFHRVVMVSADTWTIFVAGPKRKSWGFLVDGRGVVPWRERLAERGVKIDYPPTEREIALGGSQP